MHQGGGADVGHGAAITGEIEDHVESGALGGALYRFFRRGGGGGASPRALHDRAQHLVERERGVVTSRDQHHASEAFAIEQVADDFGGESAGERDGVERGAAVAVDPRHAGCVWRRPRC